MKGHPVYARGNMVVFEVKGEEKVGKIVAVESFCLEMREKTDPIYDILVEDGGSAVTYKYIAEDDILGLNDQISA